LVALEAILYSAQLHPMLAAAVELVAEPLAVVRMATAVVITESREANMLAVAVVALLVRAEMHPLKMLAETGEAVAHQVLMALR